MARYAYCPVCRYIPPRGVGAPDTCPSCLARRHERIHLIPVGGMFPHEAAGNAGLGSIMLPLDHAIRHRPQRGFAPLPLP
jgi:hypothetical protein